MYLLCKKSRSFLATLMCIIILLSTSATYSYAANDYKIVSFKHGTVEGDNYSSHSFSLPYKSTLKIDLIGLYDDYGTWGDYIIEVLDENNRSLFCEKGSTEYDDKSYTIESLPAGNYNFIIYADCTCKEYYGDYYDYYGDLFHQCSLDYCYTLKYTIEGTVPTKKLKLNKTKLTLDVGESKKLKVSSTPTYATDETKWSTSNKKVATISKSGKVKAKALGTATITAKKGKKKAKCKVTVNKMYLELYTGETKSLKKYIKNIKNYKKATFKSSDKSVVSVNSDGKIKTLKHGKATITITVSEKKYKITVYSYSKSKLERTAKSTLKNMLKNPNSLIINNMEYVGGVLVIDYSAMNGFGGYNREDFIAFYEKGKFYYMFA